MKFRPHRGMLADAMKEAVEVDGLPGLIDHLKSIHPEYGPSFDPDKITIEEYSGKDPRIGWEKTCIVLQEGSGPIGFTDSLE